MSARAHYILPHHICPQNGKEASVHKNARTLQTHAKHETHADKIVWYWNAVPLRGFNDDGDGGDSGAKRVHNSPESIEAANGRSRASASARKSTNSRQSVVTRVARVCMQHFRCALTLAFANAVCIVPLCVYAARVCVRLRYALSYKCWNVDVCTEHTYCARSRTFEWHMCECMAVFFLW